jgi:hypothetical protein
MADLSDIPSCLHPAFLTVVRALLQLQAAKAEVQAERNKDKVAFTGPASGLLRPKV